MMQRLQEWIRQPELLNQDSLYELRKLVARYPYFQTARLLLLKNLFLLQDVSFRDELRKSALYIADLSVLFYYIEGDSFVIKQRPSAGDGSGAASSDRTLDLIDMFLDGLPDGQETELELPLEIGVDYVATLQQEEEEPAQPAAPLKGQELIDSFLEKAEGGAEPWHPQSAPTEKVPETEESPAQEVSEEGYFTETLAKIYVKQQRYDKALEIIRKLNLKYPQKNAYFADQIRFLEKLIINENLK